MTQQHKTVLNRLMNGEYEVKMGKDGESCMIIVKNRGLLYVKIKMWYYTYGIELHWQNWVETVSHNQELAFQVQKLMEKVVWGKSTHF